MLYGTVLVALLLAIYVYYITMKKIMLVIILGQLFFLVGLAIDQPFLRETAHVIMWVSVLYGIFGAQNVYILGYMFVTIVFILLTRKLLKKCAFRLIPTPSYWIFPPKWLPIPPIYPSLVLSAGILMTRIILCLSVNLGGPKK